MNELHLTIKMTPDGQISVEGPLENKILCLGLLEIAKSTVMNHKVEEHRIAIPQLRIS